MVLQGELYFTSGCFFVPPGESQKYSAVVVESVVSMSFLALNKWLRRRRGIVLESVVARG